MEHCPWDISSVVTAKLGQLNLPLLQMDHLGIRAGMSCIHMCAALTDICMYREKTHRE